MILFISLSQSVSLVYECAHEWKRVVASNSNGDQNNDEIKNYYNLQTGDDLASLLCDRRLNRFELVAFACNTFHLNFYFVF